MTKRLALIGMIIDLVCVAVNILLPLSDPKGLHWWNVFNLVAATLCLLEFLRNLRRYRKG